MLGHGKNIIPEGWNEVPGRMEDRRRRSKIKEEKGPILGDEDWQGGMGRTGYSPLQGVSPTVCLDIFIRKERLMEKVHSGRFPPGARREVSHQPLPPHSINVYSNITCSGPTANKIRRMQEE